MRLTLKKIENFLTFLQENGKIENFKIERTPYKWISIKVKINGNIQKKEFYDLKETLRWIVGYLF